MCQDFSHLLRAALKLTTYPCAATFCQHLCRLLLKAGLVRRQDTETRATSRIGSHVGVAHLVKQWQGVLPICIGHASGVSRGQRCQLRPCCSVPAPCQCHTCCEAVPGPAMPLMPILFSACSMPVLHILCFASFVRRLLHVVQRILDDESHGRCRES